MTDVDKLIKALEFYADEVLAYSITQMNEPRSAVHGDKGKIARQALADYEASKDVTDDELVEGLIKTRDYVLRQSEVMNENNPLPDYSGFNKFISQAIARLQAPSNQWNFDMSLVPKGEDDMVLLLFNSASVPVVRLCWWNDDEDDGWSIGWYSSKHSVTTEKVGEYLGEPIGWCDTPDELYEACN